jgi:AraC family ethanolamine operon transcriptional activator
MRLRWSPARERTAALECTGSKIQFVVSPDMSFRRYPFLVQRSRSREPLPLSELCRRAGLKVRTLETGLREVTGLPPIGSIRSRRSNAVRRALHDAPARLRSISGIALDNGFWRLRQFATDYRKLFGETPTNTRRRSAQVAGPQAATGDFAIAPSTP